MPRGAAGGVVGGLRHLAQFGRLGVVQGRVEPTVRVGRSMSPVGSVPVRSSRQSAVTSVDPTMRRGAVAVVVRPPGVTGQPLGSGHG